MDRRSVGPVSHLTYYRLGYVRCRVTQRSSYHKVNLSRQLNHLAPCCRSWRLQWNRCCLTRYPPTMVSALISFIRSSSSTLSDYWGCTMNAGGHLVSRGLEKERLLLTPPNREGMQRSEIIPPNLCLVNRREGTRDKMCSTRLAPYMETNRLRTLKLNTKEYGFCKNISTVDALHELLKYIAESKRSGIYTSLLTLDIKSALNSGP